MVIKFFCIIYNSKENLTILDHQINLKKENMENLNLI